MQKSMLLLNIKRQFCLQEMLLCIFSRIQCDSAVFNYKKSTVVMFGQIKRAFHPREVDVPGLYVEGITFYLKKGIIRGGGYAQ